MDNFLVKYVSNLPEGSMIRELCLQRETDDLILSKPELSMLIDDVLIKLTFMLLLKNIAFILHSIIYYKLIKLSIAFLYSLIMSVLYDVHVCTTCMYMYMFKTNKFSIIINKSLTNYDI